jgi:hypothetical protein
VIPLADTLKGNFVRKVIRASKHGAIEIVGTAGYVAANTMLVVDRVEGLPRWVKNKPRRAADFGGLFEDSQFSSRWVHLEPADPLSDSCTARRFCLGAHIRPGASSVRVNRKTLSWLDG